MTTTKTQETIKSIRGGQVYWIEAGNGKVMTRRLGDGYQVECIWRVMEGYSDDPLSSTYQPLGPGVPFRGVRVNAETSAAAATIMEDMVAVSEKADQPSLKSKYSDCERIGNVARD